MLNYVKLVALGLITLVAMIAANYARDLSYMVHAMLIMVIAGAMFLWVLRNTDEPVTPDSDLSASYMDGVIRYGVIATAFWGIAGFLVGTFIAFQLAFPGLNFDWSEGYANFGRLRPLHTSAVIFAFGGNALICTSFYVVQRTCAARLWGGNLAWFVFWGYQLFIVLAATGYLLGATQSKEYAEPEWYVDIWLTLAFGWAGYLMKLFRFEPAPFLIGFVLGPMMEEQLRRAMLLSRGDPTTFLTRPISGTLIVITVLLLAWSIRSALKARRHGRAMPMLSDE